MYREIEENVFHIPVTLPGNPLGYTNTYLLRGEKSLLIDTGLENSVCRREMLGALSDLRVKRDNLDILITHFHEDHVGLADKIMSPHSKVFAHRVVESRVNASSKSEKEDYSQFFHSCGIHSVYKKFSAFGSFDLENLKMNLSFLDDGDVLSYGGHHLHCLFSPGHCKDHICLYEPGNGWLFCGDTILDDVTPNLSGFDLADSSLDDYFNTLKKIDGLDVSVAYCGHGKEVTDCSERIQKIVSHHEHRLNEVLRILDGGRASVMEIASRMRWNVKESDWWRFSYFEKLCSMGEAMAHLAYLHQQKKIEVQDIDGVLFFSRASQT
jgi:glyoxylase-like metal-dependent hydrolase (beta-lactamase superfamily II)